MQPRRTQKGFTLVELMVVVAIIAVLSAVLFSVSGRTYGANAMTVSDKISSTMSWVRMRAVSSRRIMWVEVKSQEILVWQGATTGFATPASWEFVQRVTIPSGVTIWDVEAPVRTTTGNTVTQNASLDFDLFFKPDGSSSGSTIYVTDSQHSREYRVLVYKATGSSYARQTW